MTLAQYVRSAPRSTLLAIALALACSTPAAAAGDITLELNKVTAPDGAACRLHFLLANDTAEGFFAFQLQMSFFDTDGGFLSSATTDFLAVRPKKTVLRYFDVPDLSCDELGSVLLNDVVACTTESGSGFDCLAVITPTNRGPVRFYK